ncbi:MULTISPECIES: aminopeptidase N [Streptomyces]|uniref:Aminopeptidase N n=1 Tax=Streptomyces thermoviolaceus subsp. thermoviolaceus TaxID=66860 RepID=A0ABX0YVT7_STRTL|nr:MULTISPECIES: aminopeptidase N [Streptomyces]MCM3266095.1 aminopeptidase N [Streptomyces thermoviolaceus]NJP16676.1 aminopeptidase N [Streptomyces thermoviolaceus subsp. thermoviolaceus]RSR99853.1 aminopeptidase N [Streptomyces sp. WAC00469]WTD49217.1 aminopeptidase N [Streptomyces thermoviolaceus]GGV80215.1 aminopeptidase [Streptomyces thermoviolaceus subsp. apingens]
MPGENLSREEARERAALLSVDGYEVSLDVRSAVGETQGEEPRTFRSVTTIRFRCNEPGASSFADLIAPSVTAVSLNGKDLDPSEVFDGSRILLEDLAADNELIVDARCAYSRTGEGLHRFVDPEDGEVYLYTQYEPADARRVFANFEQPDLKAPFRFEVTAPEGWTVWSNGAGERHDGVWRFAETKPISTYITCVVAGPYHYVTDTYERQLADGSRLRIPLGAMCRKSLAKHFDADDVFLVTKQGLDFFHDRFDYPYPFGKYDQAFVPEYNLGAMENPGLVTFREEYIFRGKVTQASYEARANVVLHEMAHMWFGDLVTMEWWDDLWLKESFADFMGAFALVGATRFTDGWITFANRRKAWAYRADQWPSTHPITADIRDLQDAKLNFDGITYAKGASVLKQLVAYVGQDAFLEGARRYFKRHAYGNTRLGDLLAVLEETSGRDMAAWARSWLQTAGLNALTPQVTLDADGRIQELAVLQEAAESHPELRPHRVAVGLYRRSAAGALERYARTEVDVAGARTVVTELAGQDAPDLVLVNDDDLTYCKIRFDATSLATLRTDLGALTDPLARALCWSALWNLTRDALLPARDFLDLVLRFAGRETEIGVLQMLHAWAESALVHYVAPDRRETAGQALAEGALAELRNAEPGSEHQLAWARFFASVASAPADLELLKGLLDGTERIEGLDVDQELRWAFLEPLAAHGVADEARLAEELARDDTASGKRHQVRCLAARPSAEVKARAWHDVVESDALSNALVEATIAGFARPSQRELLAPYAEKYFAVIERVWAERSIQIAMDVVQGLFPALQASPATLEATDAWLSAHESAPPALRRLVLEARDDLARALRGQECDARA